MTALIITKQDRNDRNWKIDVILIVAKAKTIFDLKMYLSNGIKNLFHVIGK